MRSITDIIKNASHDAGLNFYNGFQTGMADERLSFPLVWLEPPVVKKKEGIKEGIVTYALKMHILTTNKNFTSGKKSRVAESLEKATLALCNRMVEEPEVADIRKLTCTPNIFSLTNYGEIGVTATFEADKIFCEEELKSCDTE